MDVTPPTVVEISIEHLTIEGFGAMDSFAVRLALQRDLARLVEERGLPVPWTTPGTHADISASLDWDGRGGADGLSAALAERLYDGFAS
jgi:hypothetical protein